MDGKVVPFENIADRTGKDGLPPRRRVLCGDQGPPDSATVGRASMKSSRMRSSLVIGDGYLTSISGQIRGRSHGVPEHLLVGLDQTGRPEDLARRDAAIEIVLHDHQDHLFQ